MTELFDFRFLVRVGLYYIEGLTGPEARQLKPVAALPSQPGGRSQVRSQIASNLAVHDYLLGRVHSHGLPDYGARRRHENDHLQLQDPTG